jgi:hypothetical protein
MSRFKVAMKNKRKEKKLSLNRHEGSRAKQERHVSVASYECASKERANEECRRGTGAMLAALRDVMALSRVGACDSSLLRALPDLAGMLHFSRRKVECEA